MDSHLNHIDFNNTEIDAEFEPIHRNRSNTWPIQRPDIQNLQDSFSPTLETFQEGNSAHSSFNTLIPSTASNILLEQEESSDQQDDLSPQSAVKKNSSRRNAWGNHSYADLITQAINLSPEKRLTLSQIYEWMVQNVEYFKDKGDSNSSAGWKNSIRHNLSLHSRFMRIQNDGAGKSSWWMINPDARPGKGARRRASSMETKAYEKKKRALRPPKNNMRHNALTTSLPGGQHNLLDQNILEHTPSPCSSHSENIDHLDRFPESPQLIQSNQLNQIVQAHPSVHQNQLHTQSSNQLNNSPIYHQLNGLQQTGPPPPMYGQTNNCNLLGQMNSPPDHQQFRTRTASNASSCGRFSPLDEHNIATSLSPLTNWQQQQSQLTNSQQNTSVNNYGQLDNMECPNEIDFSSLSIGNDLNQRQHHQPPNNQPSNGQLTNSNSNNYNQGANYLNNNMYIGNQTYQQSDVERNFMNRSQPNNSQLKINTSNMIKTATTQQNSINSNLNNINNLNSINNLNQLNCNDSLLSCGDNLYEEPSFLSDGFNNSNLMPNSNQSIDSYLHSDYSLAGQSSLMSDSLNCDSSNPNEDVNNNRIFALTDLNSTTTQVAQSTNFNNIPSSTIRYDQRTAQYNLNNDRVMFSTNQNQSIYHNTCGNQLSSGQQQMLNNYNSSIPNDLDNFNYSAGLECDIESVLNKEINFGEEGPIDFDNFDIPAHSSSTSTSTNNTISNQTQQSCVN